MTIAAERQWVSYREATEITGLSRGPLWKLVSAGEIRAAKIGKAVRINRRSLDAYLEEQSYTELRK